MKQAFVSEKYGTLTLSVIRDANPSMLITVDLGLPTMPQFSLKLPFPEHEALNANYIFNCGVAVLVEQIHIFLNRQGFVENDIIETINSLYTALEQYKIEVPEAWEEGDTAEMHEIHFPLTESFYQEIQDHLVSNKQSAYENKAKEFELRLQKRTQDQKAKEEAGEIISRFKNNIYKNSPGQLFVTLYDRFGKPSGVARVTNQGLTRFAGGPQSDELAYCDACDTAFPPEEDHVCPEEVKQAAMPSSTARNMYWWHGTTKKAAELILKNGISAQEISHEGGPMAPQRGRSYFSSSPTQAINYSIDRVEAIDGSDNGFVTLYVFRVPGTSLNDITLDEDSVGAILSSDEGTPLAFGSGVAPVINQRAVEEVYSKLYDYFYTVAPEVFWDGELNWEELQNKKALVKRIPEDLVHEAIEVYGMSVASDSIIWPDKLFVMRVQENTFDYDAMQGTPEDNLKKLYDNAVVNVIDVHKTSKTSSMMKVAYVARCPGHRNSKGELAEWCIKSHETGKIISSHKTEAAAKKHLQDMHIHKNGLFNRDTFNYNLLFDTNKPLPRSFFDDDTVEREFEEAPKLRTKTSSVEKFAASIPARLLRALENLTDEPTPFSEIKRRNLHLDETSEYDDDPGSWGNYDRWKNEDKIYNLRKRVKMLREQSGLALPVVGHGSSRVTLKINNGTVLKLAKNSAGVSQNKAEVDAYNMVETCSMITQIYYYAEDYEWVISEYAYTPSYGELEELLKECYGAYTGFESEDEDTSSDGRSDEDVEEVSSFSDISDMDAVEMRYDSSIEAIVGMAESGQFGDVDPQSVKDLRYLIDTLHLKSGDLEVPENWGVVTRKGQMYPVIVDYGFNEEVREKHYKHSGRETYMVDQGEGTPQHLRIQLESKFGNWDIGINVNPESEWILADIDLDSNPRPMTAKGKNSWDLERDLKHKIDWHYIMLKKDLRREIEEGHKPKYTYHELELDNARLVQEMIYEVERHLGPEQPKTRW